MHPINKISHYDVEQGYIYFKSDLPFAKHLRIRVSDAVRSLADISSHAKECVQLGSDCDDDVENQWTDREHVELGIEILKVLAVASTWLEIRMRSSGTIAYCRWQNGGRIKHLRQIKVRRSRIFGH